MPATPKFAQIEIAQQTLRLLPGGAAHWTDRDTLLAADIHLGRSAAFRRQAIYLPHGAESADLAKLAALVRKTSAKRLIILGDLFHAREGMSADTLTRFGEWLEGLPCQVVLVEGNHDRRARRYRDDWPLTIHRDPLIEPPFVLAHEPEASPDGYVLAGHLHPGVKVRDAAGCAHRAKAFWQTGDFLVLPAFGATTSAGAIPRAPGHRLFVCTDELVAPL